VSDAMMQFMAIRQSVALRLHIGARNWIEAYILYHRMSAYRSVALEGMTIGDIGTLAGTTMAAIEAGEYSDEPAIVDPAVADDLLDYLHPRLRSRITRARPAGGDSARAYLRIDPQFGEPMNRRDAAFDIPAYLKQFI
jgi:hypothetical protein